jgi:hypothetical protein
MVKNNIKSKQVAASSVAVVAVAALAFAAAVVPVGAASGDKTNPAQITQLVEVGSDSVITLDASITGTASIGANISVDGGRAISLPNTLTVETNDVLGFTLKLSMVNGDSHSGALFSGDTTDTIAGLSAAGTLADDTWGYATGSGVTTASTFSPVKAYGSGDTILDSSAPGDDSIDVTYGAKVSNTLASGTAYSNSVTYTASINHP